MNPGVLRSDEFAKAADLAINGQEQSLERLLLRHSNLPSSKPNLELAEALGEYFSRKTDPVELDKTLSLCELWMADRDEREEGPPAFRGIVVAYILAMRVREDELAGPTFPKTSFAAKKAKDKKKQKRNERAWTQIFELALDERGFIRDAVRHSLSQELIRKPQLLPRYIAEGRAWTEAEDRESRFASTASMVEIIMDKQTLAQTAVRDDLLSYLDDCIEVSVNAPRAAERSPARRKLLTSLTLVMSEVVFHVRDGEEWLTKWATNAGHDDLRYTIEQAILRLTRGRNGIDSLVAPRISDALKASAKPDRHEARIRQETRRRSSR